MCFLENTYYYELYGKEKREQGRAQMADKFIRNLLKDGVSVELVSKWTGVPINQIKSFKF
jgi:hypothetical protein